MYVVTTVTRLNLDVLFVIRTVCGTSQRHGTLIKTSFYFQSHNPFEPMFPAYLQISPYLQIYRSVSPDLQIFIVTLSHTYTHSGNPTPTLKEIRNKELRARNTHQPKSSIQ